MNFTIVSAKSRLDENGKVKSGHEWKDNKRVDHNGTTWIRDREGEWPIINGRPYYGLLVHNPDGTCDPV